MANNRPVILRFTTLFVLFLIFSPALSQNLRTSVKSGNWSNKNTWDCNCVPSAADHAIVATGHIVTFISTNTITNLTIELGATVTDNGLSNTIEGNLIVNGTYSGSGTINLTGNNSTIEGTGTISNSAAILVTGDKYIPPSASLTINSSNINIQGAYAITNYGVITVGGNINGTVLASTWINEANSTLNIGGSSGVPLLSTGILHAYAAGNTVNYYAAYAHTLKLPSMQSGYNTYHHLKISGSNTKTLPNGDVAVNGDLTINSTFSGSGSAKKLYLRGNWINNGNFTEGTGLGTVTFDGAYDQFITRAATENMNVVVVNKTSGKVVLNTSLIAERGLTMIAGDIDVLSNKLTLGFSKTITGTFSWTAGTIIGKFERWISAAGVPILFPIGTSTHYRPTLIQFNSLTAGSLIAEFINTSPGKNGMPLNESGVTLYNTFRDGYWSLTAANSLDTLNYNLDLTGNGFSGFAINDNTRLLRRTSSVDPWTLHGSHLARLTNTVRRTNMSLLSGQYCFGDDTNCTIPVTSVITGSPDVCRNQSGEAYMVTNNPPNTYAWNVTGGSIVSGNGTHSIMVDWGSTGMTGLVSVIEKNTCTEGAEESMAVNIHALPSATITGKVNVPENGVTAETYSVPALPGYTYTWIVTGGVITSGQGTNTITVKWGINGAGSVCVTGNHAPILPAVSCGLSISSCRNITIYKVINSVRSGNWQTSINWDCICVPGSSDNVTIMNTHSISLNGDRTINHVNINPGGSVNTNSNDLTITGDLAVNGTLAGTGLVSLNGTGTTLDGIGVITNSGLMNINGTKAILSTATLTKNSGNVILGSSVLTNYGTITIGNTLAGIDANSQWINAANSTLNIAGDLLSVGKLYASANGNTVRFYGPAPQNITTPVAGQYANVSFAGTGTKTAPASVMYVSENFTNDGDFQHNNGTVSFNGTSHLPGTSVSVFKNIVLETLGSLTFPSSDVDVIGNIDFESGSIFDPATGAVVLSGVTAQNIDVNGADFYTLRVKKAGGVVNVNSLLPVLHLLDFQTPTVFNTNGHLVIKSLGNTTNLDGAIGVLPATNLIQGDVTVDRFMNPIGNTFRYVTSPVENALPPIELGSAIYDHVNIAGSVAWKKHTVATPLGFGKGYAVLMPGGSNPVTWSVTGIVHQGDFTWNLNDEGWHLLGNPYASSIRWFQDPQAWSLTNISATIAVTDNTLSGYPNYIRYWNYAFEDDPTIWEGSKLQKGVVAMSQAFWVYAGSGGGSITIKEPAKAGDVHGKFYRKKDESTAEKLIIALSNEKYTDLAYVNLHPDATNEFELRHDAMKLWNEEVNVYLMDDEENRFGIYALNKISEEKDIPVGMQVSEPGAYTISIKSSENFNDGAYLFLVDALEKQVVRVGTNLTYSFSLDDINTPLNERFYLTRSSNVFFKESNTYVNVYPNPVSDFLSVVLSTDERAGVSLLDAHGNTLRETEVEGSSQIDLRLFPKGVYFVKIASSKKVEVYKIIK